MESTTDILRERAKRDDDLVRTVGISLGGHAVVIALVVFFPVGFLDASGADDLDEVMTISLGGPAGPSVGGQTALAARPVQEVIPLQEADQDQWIQPPTPEPPEMTIPEPEAPRRPERDVPSESAPEESRGRTPTRGPELREGNALAETGSTGGGLGLSAGGLGGAGYLEVGDFCCPEYLSTMMELIRRNWNHRQGYTGGLMMKFTIERDGSLTSIERETTSGYFALDQSAERALRLIERLPPLPSRFPENDLTVHLSFQYER